jgi:uncharacterized membrane protein HdeD (DUF308 family)/alpha-beta hydrolase superfamily lysophospholipase
MQRQQLLQAVLRLPWWIAVLIGVASICVGIGLAARPFSSLAVLLGLVVLGLILNGLRILSSAETAPRDWLAWLSGISWIVVGLVAAIWPGLTIQTLVTITGIVLIIGGFGKLIFSVSGRADDRLLTGLNGFTNICFGWLALTVPAASVLVLAVLFGISLMVFGIMQVVAGLRGRRAASAAVTTQQAGAASHAWPYWLLLTGAIAALALALGGITLSLTVRRAQPPPSGPFYAAPLPLPDGPPGTIIRSELMDGFFENATAYRVLYKSTGFNGKPAAVSGIIIFPTTPAPPEGRKVVAWTHGTTGVAPNCGPSLIEGAAYSAAIPGLSEFMAAGYVVAATDYQGLGTAGPHPYIVGTSEGMNALDSVRAAHLLPEAAASTDFAVWGESQGGHASLFTGQLAASYAAELKLHGVVASAPAADLLDLFKTKMEAPNPVGNLLISMAIASWARVHEDASLDQIVFPAAQSLVTAIADNCIQNPEQIQASIPAAMLLNMVFISNPPWETEPWKALLAENTPGNVRTSAPILIQQGTSDQVISPVVQEQFAAKLCAAGDNVEYRTYPGIGHLTIAHDTKEEVVAWIADRFGGNPATTTCR